MTNLERKTEDMTAIAQTVNQNTQIHGHLVEVTPFEWPETPHMGRNEAVRMAETRINRLVLDARKQARAVGLL